MTEPKPSTPSKRGRGRRTFILLLLVLLADAGLAVWLTGGFRDEPLHKGKPISFWVERVQQACAVSLWQLDAKYAQKAAPLVVQAAAALSWRELIPFAERHHLDIRVALPALRAMQNNESPEMRKLVREALETIERTENKEQVRTNQ